VLLDSGSARKRAHPGMTDSRRVADLAVDDVAEQPPRLEFHQLYGI
jgi:hypothetical protein